MTRRYRSFLAPPSSEVDSYVVAETGDYPLLKIANCDQAITLYFDMRNRDARKRARTKLDRLYKALDMLNEALTDAEVEAGEI